MKIIDENTLVNISKLAKIKIDENSKDELIKKLEKLLNYFKMIDNLNLNDIEPMTHIQYKENLLRDDIPEDSLTNDEVLLNSPEKKFSFFSVPKVIKND